MAAIKYSPELVREIIQEIPQEELRKALGYVYPSWINLAFTLLSAVFLGLSAYQFLRGSFGEAIASLGPMLASLAIAITSARRT